MEAVKRRGRPVASEEVRKSDNFKFRARGGLRPLLEASAQSNSRSVSEEIERRLEHSFNNPCAGEDRTAVLLKNVAEVISMMERTTNKSWWDDEFTASLCGDIVREIVNAVLPHKDVVENRLIALAEPPGAKELRKGKEELWNITVQMHAYDRAISILGGEPLHQVPPLPDEPPRR